MDQKVDKRDQNWTVGARPAPFSQKKQDNNLSLKYLTINKLMTQFYNP